MRLALVLAVSFALSACGVSAEEAADSASAAAAATTSPTPLPSLPQNQGTVLTTPRVVAIVASNDSLGTNLAADMTVLPSTGWWSQIAAAYGLGALRPTVGVVGPAIPEGSFGEQAVSDYIGALVQAGAAPAPDGKSVYVVFLPEGVTYADSSAGGCGHAPYPLYAASLGDNLAVVSRGEPATAESQENQLTRMAGWEIVDSATDPVPGAGFVAPFEVSPESTVWFGINSPYVGAANLCEGTRIVDPSGVELPRVWSDVAAGAGGDPCIPTLGVPYYNVSGPSGFAVTSPGGSVTISLTGWATGPVPDWSLFVDIQNTNISDNLLLEVLSSSKPAGPSLSTSLGDQTLVQDCGSQPAMNAGESASLTVTIPAEVPSGSYVILLVGSVVVGSDCAAPLSQDEFHFTPVGVFVQ